MNKHATWTIPLLSLSLLLAATAPSIASDTPTVVVSLGDSITSGTSNDPEAEPYPSQLQTILGADYHVENCGFPGQTTAYLLSRFASLVAPKTPDTLVILAGVNDINIWDASQDDRRIYSPEHVIKRLREIGEKAQAIGASTIYLTIWPDDDFDATKVEAIASINHWIRESSAKEVAGAQAIDIAKELLAETQSEDHLLDAKYHDGSHLHLNQLGYATVANAVASQLQKAESQ